MSNTDEQRWLQRFDNFTKALLQLDEACEKDSYTHLERAGLAQTFMFSCELAWKTLKDLLFYEGYDTATPRATIQQSFEAEYLDEDDCETFLDALSKRNLLSHIYSDEVAREAETLIKDRYRPMLHRLLHTLERRRGA